MDSPERNKNGDKTTSTDNFEQYINSEIGDVSSNSIYALLLGIFLYMQDSPVFSFLDNLSPIKPIKSTDTTQMSSSLSFASLPSVFTSPHVNSIRGSRFRPRHQLSSDLSKQVLSSFDEANLGIKRANFDSLMESDEEKENLDPRTSGCAVVDETVYAFSRLGENSQCSSGHKNLCRADYTHNSSVIPLVEEASKGYSYRNEVHKEVALGESLSIICDAEPSLFTPQSQNEFLSYNRLVQADPATSFYKNIKNAIQKCQFDTIVGTMVPQHLSGCLGKGNQMMVSTEVHDVIPCPAVADSFATIDDEQLSVLYGGVRRCPVFEPTEDRIEHTWNSVFDSSLLPQPVGNCRQQLFQVKRQGHSPVLHQLLPAIGLHLNSLATSSSGRLLNGNDCLVNSSYLSSSGELVNNTFDNSYFGRGGTSESIKLHVRDPFGEMGYIVIEDVVQSSNPKKKRMKMENAAGGKVCKRCNCKKSKCLKLYCDCFAAGVYCMEPCACINCLNKPAHEETVIATRKQIETRNPLAFAPKVIRVFGSQSDALDESGKSPASARHKRGCNCKRSGCLKKYCECYQSGVGCSNNCRCEACRNAYGIKDGFESEAEDGVDMTDINQNQNADSSASLARCSINARHIGSSFPAIGSSSNWSAAAAEKSLLFPIEVPEFILKRSPIGGIKSSSPNGKRVSPPQVGSSTTRRLKLESITSVPSLC